MISFEIPSFLDLGAMTNGVIVPLFQLFKNDNVAPALASSILGVAVLICVLFTFETLYIAFQIGRRTISIRRIKSKAEFTDALPRVQRLMLSSGYLRHSWEKFRETLVEPTSSSESPTENVIRNTERPQIYFNMAEAGLRFPLYKAVPNLLVGIGLLLTFVGLVTALYFTTEALNQAHDLDASQNALKNLLHAASFKFYTSVAGLGGSILVTIVLRIGVAKVESSFDKLASALESKILLITPESIAFDHYREAQEQTRNLKLFNTEVAISVGQRIEEALAATLPKMLAQAVAPIGERLADVADKLDRKSEGAIGDMANSFADRLQGATGEQMQRLADTLGDLRTSIDQINTRMNESGSGLAQNVARSTQDLEAAIRAMTSAVDEMTTKAAQGVEGGSSLMQEKLSAAVGALETVGAKVAKLVDESSSKVIGETERASSRLHEQMVSAAEQILTTSNQTASQIRDVMNEIANKIASRAGAIGDDVVAAARSASEQSTQRVITAGSEVAQNFKAMGSEFNATLDQLHQKLGAMVDQMGSVESSIAGHANTLANLSRATEATGTALSGTARSIREAGEPIAESARLIAAATRTIADVSGGTEKAVLAAQNEIRQIAEALKQALDSTRLQWEGYERRFSHLDESLGVVLERIIKSVQENLEGLRLFVERVDEKLAGAVDRLGGGIEDLGEFAQSIEQITSRLGARPEQIS